MPTLLSFACASISTFTVTSPRFTARVIPFHNLYRNIGGEEHGELVIEIKFNRSVETLTVMKEETLLIKKKSNDETYYSEDDLLNLSLSETWSPDNKNLTVKIPAGELLTNTSYKLILKGTITDVHGEMLDGDHDGKAGGDYEVILKCQDIVDKF
jgi:hypothetical protein